MLWKLYSPGKLSNQSNYDVIVVGSGIGGLTAAALLAKLGKRVLVLEKHYVAGGFTHSFSRKGYDWDVGAHYIGDVLRPESFLRRTFDLISEERLKWLPLPDVYDRAVFPEGTYDFVTVRKQFRERLLQYFPNERKCIDSYSSTYLSSSKDIDPLFYGKDFEPDSCILDASSSFQVF